MATVKPVLCLSCGAQVRKNGYCSACNMPVWAVKKAYNTSDYHYNIGYDKACARDLSGAMESLLISLRYNKKNIATRNLLGLIYYEMGEIVTAISHWVISENYQEKDNLATKYLKEIKGDSNKLEEAEMISKKYNTALSYAASYDYDLALIQLKNVLGANPHFVKGLLLLALIHIQDNNYEKARAAIGQVLNVDKANPTALHYLREMGGDMPVNISENDYIESMSKDVEEDEDLLRSPKRGVDKIISRKEAANVPKSITNEVNLAKYSGMYMLLGFALGLLIMFFVAVPMSKKKADKSNDKEINMYSEQLAIKNSSIKALNDEIDRLTKELERMYELEEAALAAKLPDYSGIQHGMSEEDIANMLKDE